MFPFVDWYAVPVLNSISSALSAFSATPLNEKISESRLNLVPDALFETDQLLTLPLESNLNLNKHH